MSVIDLGAPVVTVWPGAPVGGTYAVAITRPDGTSFTSPGVTTGPPAQATFVPDVAGRWKIRWTSTVEPGAFSDIADVWPTDPKLIISLEDARIALNFPGNTDPAKLEDLRLYIAAATPIIEDIVGPVSVRTETQVVQRGWLYGALYHPVATLVSVVYADGTTVPVDAYRSNIGHGLLTFYYPATQDITITYTTGNALVAQNVRLATRVLVKHWWEQDKQDIRNRSNPEMTWTPSGFAVPRRVIELCQPSARRGGFA
jgi:hypothetical protein